MALRGGLVLAAEAEAGGSGFRNTRSSKSGAHTPRGREPGEQLIRDPRLPGS